MFDRDSDPMEKRHTVCIWLPLRKLNVWLPWFFIIFLFCICSRNRNVENIHKMDWTKKKNTDVIHFCKYGSWGGNTMKALSLSLLVVVVVVIIEMLYQVPIQYYSYTNITYRVTRRISNCCFVWNFVFCSLVLALCIFIEIVLHRFHSNIHYMYIVVSCIAVMWIHVIF